MEKGLHAFQLEKHDTHFCQMHAEISTTYDDTMCLD